MAKREKSKKKFAKKFAKTLIKEAKKEAKKKKTELNAVLEETESENKDLEDTEVSEGRPPRSPFSS